MACRTLRPTSDRTSSIHNPHRKSSGAPAAQDGERQHGDRNEPSGDLEGEAQRGLHAEPYFSALILTSMPFAPASSAVSRFGSVSP